MSEWHETEYEINQRDKPNKVVKGWSNGTFGLLDTEDGVEITHLQTGFRISDAEVPGAGIQVHKLVCDELCKRYKWIGQSAKEIAESNGKKPSELKRELQDLAND